MLMQKANLIIIVNSPKIFASQKVPKNSAFSFISFDKQNKQKYYLHMIFGPSLLLLKRKFFVSSVSAEMVKTLKCHD